MGGKLQSSFPDDRFSISRMAQKKNGAQRVELSAEPRGKEEGSGYDLCKSGGEKNLTWLKGGHFYRGRAKSGDVGGRKVRKGKS